VHHVAGRIAWQDARGASRSRTSVTAQRPYQALGEIELSARCWPKPTATCCSTSTTRQRDQPRLRRARSSTRCQRRASPACTRGHYDEADDLKVDTHGAAVKQDVWQLLAEAYRLHGVRPTLLERDFNFPPLQELLREVQRIQTCRRLA
jgi:hypothetical protein